jgi:ABC-type transporter MlaC component
MIIQRFFFAFLLSVLVATSASAASVSGARQSCIRGAMAAGSAALGKPAQLNRLFERYFAGDRIAQIAAGKDWNRYSKAQREAQRKRVRQVVVYTLGNSLVHYKGSRVQFLGQSGSKVRGVVTAPNGQRSTITWHFVGPCKFVNVSIEGYGSLVSAVGKVSAKKQ